MDVREEKIRVRAYEIWERRGRTGSPEDHWLEAERELTSEPPAEASSNRSEATVEEAPPVAAVEALESTTENSAKGKGPR